MKLAIAIFRYFPYGGLQRDMKFIAEDAIKRGHEVTIFCGDWQGDKIPGADIRVIDSFVFFNIAGVRRFVKAFEKIFNRDEFDLLLGFNKMPGLDVYFAGDTCFAEKAYGDRSWFYRLAPRSQLYLRYEESVLGEQGAKQIFCLVPQQVQSIARWYSTLKDRITLLPPGISKTHIACESPQEAKAKLLNDLNLDQSAKIILCLGSGFRTKGVDISIASFAEFAQDRSDAVLLIAGGDDPKKYQQQVKQLGVDNKIHFVGNRFAVADLLHSADLLLHPARYELAGNVILEAMLCGCPVLVSPQSGFAYYVKQFDMGELIHSLTDVKQIANQINHFIEKVSPPSQEEWKTKAKKLFEEDFFSRAKVAVNCLEDVGTRLGSNTQQLVSYKNPRWALLPNLRDHETLIAELKRELDKGNVFEFIKQIQGVSVRKMPDRETIRFVNGDKTYYLKRHFGTGWWEIAKNLLQLRLPVLGAANEWKALQKLSALDIPSLQALAYGVQGRNPARQESFIITEELSDVVQLDHFLQNHSLGIQQKVSLIQKVADIAREMHAASINHRDFYLCHFMLKQPWDFVSQPQVFIIDLHRAQIRPQVPERWLVKDLASLYFSSMSLRLSSRDRLRFLRFYYQQPLIDIFKKHRTLLSKVEAKAKRLYKKHEQ
jgi:UDP-glucose:(heptosyl)LPS alpha-1,3-glucosyltransferase